MKVQAKKAAAAAAAATASAAAAFSPTPHLTHVGHTHDSLGFSRLTPNRFRRQNANIHTDIVSVILYAIAYEIDTDIYS